MSIIQAMREEFEASLPATREHLARVPEDKLEWRPAEKSLTIGQLALHIAESPGGTSGLVLNDTFEIGGGPSFAQPGSVAEILSAFEASCDTALRNLEQIETLPLDAMIRFTADGVTAFEMPRGVFLREIFLNHTYHHRGQLGVYLRLQGIPVPSTFGPSADESMMPGVESNAV